MQWQTKKEGDGLMVSKQRVPMQVAPEFDAKLKDLQRQIMKAQGENVSLRDITEKISKSPNFNTLEKDILKVANMDFKINLDRRKR